MDLLTLVITLVVVGVVLWLVNTYVPMEARIKKIVNIVVLVVVVLWLLRVFGVLDSGQNIRIGNLGPHPPIPAGRAPSPAATAATNVRRRVPGSCDRRAASLP